MRGFSILLLVAIIGLPAVSWSSPDVMKIQAQGMQLGMNLEQANMESGHILVEDLPSRTLDYLVYSPDPRSHLDYDLSLWFTNTEIPKLFQLSLERKFSAHLDTHSLMVAYREKFGEYTDFCAQDMGDKELAILVWGGEILSCTPQEPISVMSDSFVQVSIIRSSGRDTSITLTLRNESLLTGEKLLVAQKDSKPATTQPAGELLPVSEELRHTQQGAAKPILLASAESPSAGGLLRRPALKQQPDSPVATIEPPKEIEPTETKAEAEPVSPAPPAPAPKELAAATSPQEPVQAVQPVPKAVSSSNQPVEKMVFVIQTGAYKDSGEAKMTADRYHSSKGSDISIARFYDSKGKLWHILQAGAFETRAKAEVEAGVFLRLHGVKCMVKEISEVLLAERIYYRTGEGQAPPTVTKAVEPAPPATAGKVDGQPVQDRNPLPVSTDEKKFVVQIGAFKTLKYARECEELYRGKGYQVNSAIFHDAKNNSWHTVFIGYFKDFKEAKQFGESFSLKQKKDFIVKNLNDGLPVNSALAAEISSPI